VGLVLDRRGRHRPLTPPGAEGAARRPRGAAPTWPYDVGDRGVA
jgi:hypothetical protein